MQNERIDPERQRAGIRVRDYTQGRQLELNNVHSSVEPNKPSTLGRVLGFLSLGLGLAEVIMPRRILKLVGIKGNHSTIVRFLGAREIAHALLIFSQSRPYPGVFSRVVGDGMDLAFVGAALTSARTQKNRAAIASAALAGVTALDVVAATQISRQPADGRLGYSDMTREDLHGRAKNGAFRTRKSITVNRPPEELYTFWHNFANLPRFMYHLQAVQVIDEQRSHWVSKAPAGRQVAWDAEITEDRPNELIAWRSTARADVPNTGQVRFIRGPQGRGTVVEVEMEYRPPAGAIGRAVALLFGEEPGQQVSADLHRFKEMMETGEVIRSDGSPDGYGQKMQRPGQPLPNGNEERMGRAMLSRRRSRKQADLG